MPLPPFGLRREAKADKKRYADTADAGQATQAQNDDSKVHGGVDDVRALHEHAASVCWPRCWPSI